MKDQQTMYKIMSFERKCCSSVERLRAALQGHLQSGVPCLDLWEKTLSFFTLRKAILFHNGYSRCTREALRIFPAPEEDLLPLCCQQ
ncbi:hypothetical protein SKAU_G00109730 [Synaphobranchus kaupii]|uniref:Uncharacterized protein n=1 Tax=Synaphobranchus kaupii TaxID=118154 RepID=A0A9Q1G105_SYNKA|nr:hypothetical protein SKAU_G00109730 [Synaphobranchus kaupii]